MNTNTLKINYSSIISKKSKSSAIWFLCKTSQNLFLKFLVKAAEHNSEICSLIILGLSLYVSFDQLNFCPLD